jgi:LmbE family N-acetylglucosaminyl deacetylase
VSIVRGSIRAALVIAPHPDDETIGAGLLIRALARRGVEVRVAIVTDGAGSHPNSSKWPRRRLIAARRLESRRAMARVGVPAHQVRFLGMADGSLPQNSAACRVALRREIARCRHLGLIVGPDGTDAHPDHRAVARAVASCRSPARRMTYRVWPHAQRKHGRASAASATGTAVKRSLIRLYRTQLGAVRDDPGGFAIAPHELAAFSHPIEHFGHAAR